MNFWMKIVSTLSTIVTLNYFNLCVFANFSEAWIEDVLDDLKLGEEDFRDIIENELRLIHQKFIQV